MNTEAKLIAHGTVKNVECQTACPESSGEYPMTKFNTCTMHFLRRWTLGVPCSDRDPTITQNAERGQRPAFTALFA
jgi:hypothetical protein